MVREGEERGERLEGGVVGGVFGDAGIVAALTLCALVIGKAGIDIRQSLFEGDMSLDGVPVLTHTCDDETDALALWLGNLGKRLDCQSDIFFPLKPVDAEYQLGSITFDLFFAIHLVRRDMRVNAWIHHLGDDLARQTRPRLGHDVPCEFGVYRHGVSEAHAPLLHPVKRDTIQPLHKRLPPLGEEQVREVAVEQDGHVWREELHER